MAQPWPSLNLPLKNAKVNLAAGNNYAVILGARLMPVCTPPWARNDGPSAKSTEGPLTLDKREGGVCIRAAPAICSPCCEEARPLC